jgi:hypothetical protein
MSATTMAVAVTHEIVAAGPDRESFIDELSSPQPGGITGRRHSNFKAAWTGCRGQPQGVGNVLILLLFFAQSARPDRPIMRRRQRRDFR